MRDVEWKLISIKVIKKVLVILFIITIFIVTMSNEVFCTEVLLRAGFLGGTVGYGYSDSFENDFRGFLPNFGIKGLSLGMGYNFLGKHGGILSIETNEISISTHSGGFLDVNTDYSLYINLTKNVHAKRKYIHPYYYGFLGATIGEVNFGKGYIKGGVGMKWTFRFLTPGIELSYRKGIENGYSYFSFNINCELGGIYAININ